MLAGRHLADFCQLYTPYFIRFPNLGAPNNGCHFYSTTLASTAIVSDFELGRNFARIKGNKKTKNTNSFYDLR